MKFMVNKYCCSQSRLGSLLYEVSHVSHIANNTNNDMNGVNTSPEYQTPICFEYTNNGSIPHIVWDSAHHLNDDCSPILIPLASTIDMNASLRAFNKQFESHSMVGINRFVGIAKWRPSFLIIQDPMRTTKSGGNGIESVAVFGRGGNIKVGPKYLSDIIENFRPNGYQALCDSDTPLNASQKRVTKSVERSVLFLDQCIEAHSRSPLLTNNITSIYATIEGGYDSKARIKSAEESALRSVNGFIIDGFHMNGPQTETDLNIELVIPILIDIIKCLPREKPKAMFGVFRPSVILQLINNGIDIFDSSYACAVSERGHALLPIIDLIELKLNNLIINLNSDEFKTDLSLLCKDCECYTCKNNFTKAYIYHLISSKEMLANVLLMFHNLHILYNFFRDIRLIMSEDKFEQLLNNL